MNKIYNWRCPDWLISNPLKENFSKWNQSC